jgi:hypothetical protein
MGTRGQGANQDNKNFDISLATAKHKAGKIDI